MTLPLHWNRAACTYLWKTLATRGRRNASPAGAKAALAGVSCPRTCEAGRPFPSRAFAGKPEQWKTKVTFSSPVRLGNNIEEERGWLGATALHAVGMEKLR